MRTEGAGDVTRSTTSRLWRTPTPYILLVIGSMMVLIALVLLVLVCTRNSRRSRRSGSESDEERQASSARMMLAPLDREPKVAVIMAGERAPSFLGSAKPLASVAPRGADDQADDGTSAAAGPYVV